MNWIPACLQFPAALLALFLIWAGCGALMLKDQIKRALHMPNDFTNGE